MKQFASAIIINRKKIEYNFQTNVLKNFNFKISACNIIKTSDYVRNI